MLLYFVCCNKIDIELDIRSRYMARTGGNSSRLCNCVQDILSRLGEGEIFWYLSLIKFLAFFLLQRLFTALYFLLGE